MPPQYSSRMFIVSLQAFHSSVTLKQQGIRPRAQGVEGCHLQPKLCNEETLKLCIALVWRSQMSSGQNYLCSQIPFDMIVVFGGVHIVLQCFSKPQIA